MSWRWRTWVYFGDDEEEENSFYWPSGVTTVIGWGVAGDPQRRRGAPVMVPRLRGEGARIERADGASLYTLKEHTKQRVLNSISPEF